MKTKNIIYIIVILFTIIFLFLFFRESQISKKTNEIIGKIEKNGLKSNEDLNLKKDIISGTGYIVNGPFVKINYSVFVKNKGNMDLFISDINKNISEQLNINFTNISTKNPDFSFFQRIDLTKVSDLSFGFDEYNDKYNILFDYILNNKTFFKKGIVSFNMNISNIESNSKLTDTIKKINYFSYKALGIQYFSFNIRNYDIQYILTKEEFNLLANINGLVTFGVDFYKPIDMNEEDMFEFLKKINGKISDFTIRGTDYKLIFNGITKGGNRDIIYKK
ncbi:MAG: hypothetical protein PHG82_03690 [Candidatus Gracilibacteria bacterium]|nr:hypothetical protein [Candidatus Gracilibacteria bacterium]